MPTVSFWFFQSPCTPQEFLRLLACVVRHLGPRLLPDLVPLCHSNPDQDFFANLTHLQHHRRIRALSMLVRRVAEDAPVTTPLPVESLPTTAALTAVGSTPATYVAPPISQSHLVGLFVPLLQHYIYESNKQSEHNLVTQALRTLEAIARRLGWGAYLAQLTQLLRQLSGGGSSSGSGSGSSGGSPHERALISLLCLWLDAFHFEVSDAAAEKAIAGRDGLDLPRTSARPARRRDTRIGPAKGAGAFASEPLTAADRRAMRATGWAAPSLPGTLSRPAAPAKDIVAQATQATASTASPRVTAATTPVAGARILAALGGFVLPRLLAYIAPPPDNGGVDSEGGARARSLGADGLVSFVDESGQTKTTERRVAQVGRASGELRIIHLSRSFVPELRRASRRRWLSSSCYKSYRLPSSRRTCPRCSWASLHACVATVPMSGT